MVLLALKSSSATASPILLPPSHHSCLILPRSANCFSLLVIISQSDAISHFTYLMDQKTYQKCQLLSKDQSENESLFEFLLLLTVCPTFQIRSDAVCDCLRGVCLSFLFGRILEKQKVLGHHDQLASARMIQWN